MNDSLLTDGSDSSLPLADVNPSPAVSVISIKQLSDYVKKVFICFDEESPTEQLQKQLNESADLLHRFISEPQAKSLFVQKIISGQGLSPFYILNNHSQGFL